MKAVAVKKVVTRPRARAVRVERHTCSSCSTRDSRRRIGHIHGHTTVDQGTSSKKARHAISVTIPSIKSTNLSLSLQTMSNILRRTSSVTAEQPARKRALRAPKKRMKYLRSHGGR